MNTYKREFETREALVTVIVNDSTTVFGFKVQTYNKNYSVKNYSITPKQKVELNKTIDEISTKELIKAIESNFKLTNCYDVGCWKKI